MKVVNSDRGLQDGITGMRHFHPEGTGVETWGYLRYFRGLPSDYRVTKPSVYFMSVPFANARNSLGPSEKVNSCNECKQLSCQNLTRNLIVNFSSSVLDRLISYQARLPGPDKWA